MLDPNQSFHDFFQKLGLVLSLLCFFLLVLCFPAILFDPEQWWKYLICSAYFGTLSYRYGPRQR